MTCHSLVAAKMAREGSRRKLANWRIGDLVNCLAMVLLFDNTREGSQRKLVIWRIGELFTGGWLLINFETEGSQRKLAIWRFGELTCDGLVVR